MSTDGQPHILAIGGGTFVPDGREGLAPSPLLRYALADISDHLLERFEEGAWWVDLAPLSDPSLVPQTASQALGVREEFGAGALLLIEWPERAAGALPEADLELTLEHDGDARRVRGTAHSTLGRDCLAAVFTSD
jgi:hypothetical protein